MVHSHLPASWGFVITCGLDVGPTVGAHFEEEPGSCQLIVAPRRSSGELGSTPTRSS
jgi:hypothetical protein